MNKDFLPLKWKAWDTGGCYLTEMLETEQVGKQHSGPKMGHPLGCALDR